MPGFTDAPFFTLWKMTVPLSSSLSTSTTLPTVRPSPWMVFSASAWDIPVTVVTSFSSFPLLMYRVIFCPSVSSSPDWGSVRMMRFFS